MDEDVVVTSAVTTQWKSAFEVNKDFPFDGNQSAYPYIILYKSDGVYYYDGFRVKPFVKDGYYTMVDFSDDRGTHYYFDRVQDMWIKDTFEVGTREIRMKDVLAQNIFDTEDFYYTTADFTAGRVPAPVSTVFDAIYFDSPLDYVLVLVPVMVTAAVLFVGVRKGIAFIRSILNRG